MKISFKRITSSGKFIPEIDGLRFVATCDKYYSNIFHYHLSGMFYPLLLKF